MNLSFVMAAFFLFPGKVFWPYFAGIVLLLMGLVIILTREWPQLQGMDKAIVFGRVFLAVPIGVFGAFHFIEAKFVASIVPSWIPGHLFWAYFVGTALIAASLSITVKRFSVLASALLGLMLLSFVLLLHTPALATHLDDRFVLAVLLRDTSFSGGALAFALTQAKSMKEEARGRMLILVRFMIGIPTVFFGVEHFLHPQYVPVIPLDRLMPAYIPGHVPLAWITGVVLIVSGVSILVNWNARLAAAWLGIVVFVIVLLVYLPILLATPGDIGQGLNYFADTLLFSGAALALAGAIRPQQTEVRSQAA